MFNLLMFYTLFSFDLLLKDILFNIPYTSKKQYNSYLEKMHDFSNVQKEKISFPCYAKSSKIVKGNRHGRHINLERRVKGDKRLKWK
ncbi:MAG: hypothetical protein NUV46_04530 [Nanoarchaeota archaeon]|nr:hypothetical protein [Nanoarchaeota archaeon]